MRRARGGKAVLLRRPKFVAFPAAVIGALACAPQPAAAQFTQQGPKLVGTGIGGHGASEGWSVALSADGNTALVGGNDDNNAVGAVWVFTRSGGVWSQQGSKLVATDATVNARVGNSVALSADGNTALVGGNGDNNGAGAAWVFTRSGGVWSQQGSKLVGTGAAGSGGANQGWSVALSADGNTALVGGYSDFNSFGAAWVFTRSGGVWSQQGSKLVGTGATGNARKAGRWRSPATTPWWAGFRTTSPAARRGSSPAAAASGPSRARSWSGPVP